MHKSQFAIGALGIILLACCSSKNQIQTPRTLCQELFAANVGLGDRIFDETYHSSEPKQERIFRLQDAISAYSNAYKQECQNVDTAAVRLKIETAKRLREKIQDQIYAERNERCSDLLKAADYDMTKANYESTKNMYSIFLNECGKQNAYANAQINKIDSLLNR